MLLLLGSTKEIGRPDRTESAAGPTRWPLLSISVLMGLITATYLWPGIDRSDDRALSQKAESFAGAALLNHIQTYGAKGFTVSTVTPDGEPSIVSMRQVLLQNNITLNVLGRGSHAHHAESAILSRSEQGALDSAQLAVHVTRSGAHFPGKVYDRLCAVRCRARIVLNVMNSWFGMMLFIRAAYQWLNWGFCTVHSDCFLFHQFSKSGVVRLCSILPYLHPLLCGH